jgi:flavin-dependent dehydrogenase
MAYSMAPADIVIAGAGPAGASLAIHLARHGIAVTLIDAHSADPELRPEMPGDRIWSESRPLLEALDVTCEEIGRAVPATAVAWETQEPQFANPDNPLHWAWAIDRRKLDVALQRSAEGAGALIIHGSEVKQVSGKPGAWHIKLNSSEELSSYFLVDATGRAARVARHLGYQRRRQDQTVAILRWWSGGEERSPFALEAVANGWCYRLALPGGRGVIGVITSFLLEKGPPEAIWQRLTGRLTKLNPFPPVGAILGPACFFDAAPGRIDCPVGPGFAAIGEACLATDPIEGRGIDRSLRLSEAFAMLLLSPPETHSDRLAEYELLIDSLDAEHRFGRLQTYQSSGLIGPAFIRQLNQHRLHADQ